MLIRTVPPPIKDPTEFDVNLPPCDKHILRNGVEVYSLNMGTEDTLMVNWTFHAGNSYETRNLVATATSQLLKNGTGRLSAFEVNEHFEYHGASLSRHSNHETADIVLHCLSRHANDLLPVVAEIISDSRFPQKELDIFIQNSKQKLQVSLQKCEFVASRLIDAHLFGEGHPYGKYSTPADYDALRQEDLLAFFDEHYRKGRCIIFVAGKLPPGLFELLEKEFGGLSLHAPQAGYISTSHLLNPSRQKKQVLINDPEGVQAAIRIARPFPNRHHPDFKKAMVLNNIYGGFFGSRLMTNIREDKGYTYGIYSYLMNFIQESGWIISTEAGRDVSEATVSEIYKEMEEIREESIDEEELRMTRNYMIGSILGELDGPFQVLSRWKSLVLNDLDVRYFNEVINVIKTITGEELQDLAKKYLVPDEFYELVVI